MVVNAQKTQPPTCDVVLTRVFNAPRDLVFKAWTDPEQMAKWWGPDGFTNPVCELDARPGGKIRIDMRAPGGTIYPMTGTFYDVEEPTRLVFSEVAEDLEGNALLKGHTIVTFEDQGGKTKLTVRSSAVGIAPVAADMLKGMEMGWTQSLVRLDALVSRG